MPGANWEGGIGYLDTSPPGGGNPKRWGGQPADVLRGHVAVGDAPARVADDQALDHRAHDGAQPLLVRRELRHLSEVRAPTGLPNVAVDCLGYRGSRFPADWWRGAPVWRKGCT